MLQFGSDILIYLLIALAVVALLLELVLPWVDARERRQQRLYAALGGQHAVRVDGGHGATATSRRKAIEKTLKDISERQSARKSRQARARLEQRLREAGLGWQPRTYWFVSALLGASMFGALSSFGPVVAGTVALGAALVLPHLYVTQARRRRLAAFAAGFPDVIDVIVRGVRAGRPLADCLAVVAADTQEPIRSEFRLVVEDQTVGMPVQEAVDRLAQRVPLKEVGFLAIVVAIQSRAGGNLTEALGNLSAVLRGRRQLQAKVKAMSAEAKASAGIIASLPVIVACLVQLTSPDYLALLYQTDPGLMVMAACVVWMGIGAFIMRQMINFDM